MTVSLLGWLALVGALVALLGFDLFFAHRVAVTQRGAAGWRALRRLVSRPLLAALLAVAFADVIFAIDSIPAVLAITTNTFLVFAANAFALLGLRALYFLVEGAAGPFDYLHYGLAALLVFVGAKM